MGVISDFETFEKDFIELISEYNLLSSSEARLREVIRSESTRAEAAEAAKEAAERVAAESRASAAASTAGAAASHSAQALATAQEQIVTLNMKLELSERHHVLIEQKYAELLNQIAALEEEVQHLRPIQFSYSSLKSQYVELLNRINSATEDARSESTRLENELRRVEKCASAGSEIRERARLAAAAHARERRLAAAELQHATKELRVANVEISRLGTLVSELQYRLSEVNETKSKGKDIKDPDQESLVEVRAALEAERAGAARLERSLAAALADNASLASKLHSTEVTSMETSNNPTSDSNHHTNICQIDSFLED